MGALCRPQPECETQCCTRGQACRHFPAMQSGQVHTCCADADLDAGNGIAEEVALAAVVGVCLQVDAHTIAATLGSVALISAGPAAAHDFRMSIIELIEVYELRSAQAADMTMAASAASLICSHCPSTAWAAAS